MPDDYAPDLIAEMQTHGVTSWEVDRSHKHPRIHFDWRGARRINMNEDLRERALQYAIQTAGSHSMAEEVLRAARLYHDYIAGTQDAAVLAAAKEFAAKVTT